MDKVKAHLMAQELMREHGLILWRLKWDNSTRRAGVCWTYQWDENPKKSTGAIGLSNYVVAYASEVEVRDTILHEIAHALTSPQFRTHGKEWKAKALAIGCNGKRTYDPSFLPDNYKFLGTCPNGHTVKRNRRIRISCSKCSPYFDSSLLFVWGPNPDFGKVHEPKVDVPASAPKITVPTAPVVQIRRPINRVQMPPIKTRAAAYDQGTAFINWD